MKLSSETIGLVENALRDALRQLEDAREEQDDPETVERNLDAIAGAVREYAGAMNLLTAATAANQAEDALIALSEHLRAMVGFVRRL